MRAAFPLVTLLAWSCLLGAQTKEVGLPDPLTLKVALSLADEAAPALDLAQARLAEAQARQAEADALDNPKVSVELAGRLVEPSYRVVSVDNTSNDSWAKLRIRKRLYDFGRTESLLEAAEAEIQGQESRLLDVRQQRRLEIMARFFDVLLADQTQTRDNEAMAIAYVRLDRARERNRLGQLPEVDLLGLETLYQEALSQQKTSQAQQRASRSRLALALNRPGQLPANLELPELPELKRPLGEIDTLTQQALDGNPRLLAMRQEVTAGEQRAKAAVAGNGAVIHGELEATAYSRSLSSSNPFAAAVVLEVPLSTGGALEAEAARHRALAAQKRAELGQEELTLRQAVLDLWLELQTLAQRGRELATLNDYRELTFDRNRALYEMEVASDLGDSMTQISAQRLQQMQNDFRIALAWGKLDALAGVLVEGESAPFGDANKGGGVTARGKP